jgi:hypothetical protein
MHRAVPAVTGVVAALTLGSGAAAATDPTDQPTWEPPQVLEADVQAIDPELVSTTTDGTVAVWLDGTADEVRATVRPAGEPWRTPIRIGGSVSGGLEMTPMPEGAAMVAWCTDYRVMVRRLRGDGTWAAPRPIAAQLDSPWCYESFHVDAGGSGAMAVTWEREAGGGSDHPRLAYRASSGQWHSPEPIPNVADGQVVDVAVNTAGVTQVVYSELRDNLSVARLMYLRRSPAGAWSEPTAIATQAPGSLRVLDTSVASNDRGDLAVVWQRPSPDFGPETVRARFRPAGAGTGFGATRILAEVPYPSWPWYANFAVDMSAMGRTTVVLLTESDGETAVRSVRYEPSSGTWGAGRELYRPGDSHDRVDVAVNGDGEALVTVLDESAEPSELRTVVCPMFGPCDPAELVADAHPSDPWVVTELGPTAVGKLLWTDPCGDGCPPRRVWSQLSEPLTP